jgi:general L-amino acid transport system permease protein
MTDLSYVRKESHPDLPPPKSEVGVIAWLRQNLFSNWVNTLLTAAALYLLYKAVPPLFNWMFWEADWSGKTYQDCTSDGACWAMVRVRFDQFMYGFYPVDERWRINLGFLLLLGTGIPLLIEGVPFKKYLAIFVFLIYPFIAFMLFYGGMGLTVVETNEWGGLMLTLVLATVTIIVSLPLGVVFALGRRSNMPVVRIICVAFIELWRGVPLITVLFMGSVMLPLFLPPGTHFDKILRTLIVMAFFAAAYMAEVVRGGLQAIPKGQFEAAQAIGLSYWKMMGLIILPQALKIVIPGIVNTFIGLFKDTTLVLVIGLLDFLSIIQSATTHKNWLGTATEGYVFAACIYWIFCFGMSRYSITLERRLDTTHRD